MSVLKELGQDLDECMQEIKEEVSDLGEELDSCHSLTSPEKATIEDVSG